MSAPIVVLAIVLALTGTEAQVSSGPPPMVNKGEEPLQCNTCVGPDCDELELSNLAYVRTCKAGAVCQKTVTTIRVVDLTTVSVFDARSQLGNISKSITLPPVYGCSYETGCSEANDYEPTLLDGCGMIKEAEIGCVQRYCCNSHLCNGASVPKRVEISTWIAAGLALVKYHVQMY